MLSFYPLTLVETWRCAVRQFVKGGIEEAHADAELLLLFVLQMDKTQLLRNWQENFPSERQVQWNTVLQKRLDGLPVQYIIGEQFFYGRAFEVNPNVLIPRSETELLVETILKQAGKRWPCSIPLRVLDVGTGSGALAVTLAAERPHWKLTATDLSEHALAVACMNAKKHKVRDRIAFFQGDLLAPFLPMNSQAGLVFEILCCNLPYIPTKEVLGLEAKIREHEPHLALDGGEDGLRVYEKMAKQLGQLAAFPHLLIWEVGKGQANEAADLLRSVAPARTWQDIFFVQDYAGIARHVVALRV